ncbi:MAG: chromate transporter [Lachnospiraceae bacterium]|nr:chromate transporter [Lachnospiraceae bacterium]
MNEYLDLYTTFVRIGCVTFGGGYAMLPILERELVDKKHWTTMDDLRDYFSIGQCTPGIIALNVSTFIGEKKKGVPGALLATTGFLTGPIIIILIIASFLTNFAEQPIVQHAFAGIRVCVCVLIVQAVLRLWKKSIVDGFTLFLYLVIFVLNAFSGILPVRVPAAVLVIIAGVVGVLMSMRNRTAYSTASGGTAGNDNSREGDSGEADRKEAEK